MNIKSMSVKSDMALYFMVNFFSVVAMNEISNKESYCQKISQITDQEFFLIRQKILKILNEDQDVNQHIELKKIGLKYLLVIFASKFKNQDDILRLLIQKGAQINIKDIQNPSPINTALNAACYYGNFEAAKILLSHGADPNLKSDFELTPLAQAIDSFSSNKYLISKLLLESSADANLKSGFGDSPIIKAVKKCCEYKRYIKNLSAKYKNKAEFWQKEYNQCLDIIKILLYHGANPYQKNDQNKFAIEIAIDNDLKDLAQLMKNAQKILINKLTKILIRGDTPFSPDIGHIIAQLRYNY